MGTLSSVSPIPCSLGLSFTRFGLLLHRGLLVALYVRLPATVALLFY